VRGSALAAAALLALAGCGGGGGDGQAGGPLEIELREIDNSGESGFAELTPAGARTDVLVQTTGATGGVSGGIPNPVHIHKGTCADLDPKPAYSLPSLQEGISATTIDVSLDELLEGGYAINVQKSAKEPDVYVACGEIKK
jgi:hypothetical protein